MAENHHKPTPEELKQAEDEAIALANELEKNPPKPEEEEDSEEVKELKQKEEEEKKPPVEEVKTEEPKVEVQEQPKEQADPSKELYKNKFSQSSREAQKLHAKNRVMNNAIVEANELPEPTDDEMKAKYGADDWDLMSTLQKESAKELVISKRSREIISQAKEKAKNIDKWDEDVDKYVDDPQTLIDIPDLEGKTEEFKEFATVEENNNVPFKLLVSAFLHQRAANKVEHKGAMFPTGSGGPNTKDNSEPGTISLEEGRKLRESNYDEWKKLNNAGKIRFDL